MGQSLLLFSYGGNKVGDDLISGWNVTHCFRTLALGSGMDSFIVTTITAEPLGKLVNLD